MENKSWLKILAFFGAGIAIALALVIGGKQAIQTWRPPQPTPTPTPPSLSIPSPLSTTTPIPPKPFQQVQIINSNVCLRKENGQVEVLVDQENFASISRFADVSVSPDQKKICFLGHTATPIWLFWANIDGSEAIQVAPAKNCVWSPDSQKIAYNNHVTDVSPVDVYLFYLTTQESQNLTQRAVEQGYLRFYETPRWSPDGQKISAKFTTIELPDERTRKKGLSEINLSTGEIKDQLLEEGLVDF